MKLKYVRHLDPWKLPEGTPNAGRVLREPDALNIRVPVMWGERVVWCELCDAEQLERITEEEWKGAI